MKLTNKQILVLLLGATPAILGTKNLVAAAVLGVAVLLILLLSNVVVSALKSFLESWVARLFIAVLFTLPISMLLNAFLGDIYEVLGTSVVVVCVSFMAYDSTKYAQENSIGDAVKYALVNSVFYLVVLVATALVRELCGNGSIAGVELAFLNNIKISALQSAFGGFLVYGFMAAAAQAIFKTEPVNPQKEVPAVLAEKEAE